MTSIISGTPTGNAGSATVTCTIADATVGYDSYVAIFYNGSLQTSSDNNGATPYAEVTNGYRTQNFTGMQVSLYRRRNVAGDPTSLSFNLSSSLRWSAIPFAVESPDPSTPIEVTMVWDDSATNLLNTLNAQSITTLTDGAIHLLIASGDSPGNSITLPSGYTSVANVATNQSGAVCYKAIATAGATGAQTVNFSLTDGIILGSLAIKWTINTSIAWLKA